MLANLRVFFKASTRILKKLRVFIRVPTSTHIQRILKAFCTEIPGNPPSCRKRPNVRQSRKIYSFWNFCSCKETTVCLFGNQECPEISMTSNHRQNCRIGQPFTKKWFFSPDQFGPWPERKGKSGEIRSLLETLGSTLYPRKKLYLPKSYMDYNFC